MAARGFGKPLSAAFIPPAGVRSNWQTREARRPTVFELRVAHAVHLRRVRVAVRRQHPVPRCKDAGGRGAGKETTRTRRVGICAWPDAECEYILMEYLVTA
jgi:hypothetical protein